MPHILWDASALAKRYAPEMGSETVEAIADSHSSAMMVTTFLSYAETFSLLLRKHNRSDISLSVFSAAVLSLQTETLNSLDFNLLTITDLDIIGSVEYMREHNINASDATILTTFLRYSRAELFGSSPCILIVAD
jgi:predicted nucleic acid-binding protein